MDGKVLRSRRSLLTGAAGGLAALVAGAMSPGGTRAGTDGDVVLGADNFATRVTRVDNTTSDGIALYGHTEGTGAGVYGWSVRGAGVLGDGFDVGVRGDGRSTTKPAIAGVAHNGTAGVFGWGLDGGANPPLPDLQRLGTGVYGVGRVGVIGEGSPGVIGYGGVLGVGGVTGLHGTEAPDDAVDIAGVSGYSATGFGVYGRGSRSGVYGEARGLEGGVQGVNEGAEGIGVEGRAGRGTAIRGTSETGRGVRGSAPNGIGGSFSGKTALETDGPVRHLGASGAAWIPAGMKTFVVTSHVRLTAASIVLATLQSGDPGPGVAIQRVAKDPTRQRFTIVLTASTQRLVQVGWFVIG